MTTVLPDPTLAPDRSGMTHGALLPRSRSDRRQPRRPLGDRGPRSFAPADLGVDALEGDAMADEVLPEPGDVLLEWPADDARSLIEAALAEVARTEPAVPALLGEPLRDLEPVTWAEPAMPALFDEPVLDPDIAVAWTQPALPALLSEPVRSADAEVVPTEPATPAQVNESDPDAEEVAVGAWRTTDPFYEPSEEDLARLAATRRPLVRVRASLKDGVMDTWMRGVTIAPAAVAETAEAVVEVESTPEPLVVEPAAPVVAAAVEEHTAEVAAPVTSWSPWESPAVEPTTVTHGPRHRRSGGFRRLLSRS